MGELGGATWDISSTIHIRKASAFMKISARQGTRRVKSKIRITIQKGLFFVLAVRRTWQCEKECCPLPGFALSPDCSAMALDDVFDDG
jgi:hypothetical protein